MGSSASNLAQSCCSCCRLGSEGKYIKAATSITRDDTWFEQDSVPLLSYLQDRGAHDTQVSVREMPAMRSSKHTTATENNDAEVSVINCVAAANAKAESPNSSSGDGSWEFASPHRDAQRSSPRSHVVVSNEDDTRNLHIQKPCMPTRQDDQEGSPKSHPTYRSLRSFSTSDDEKFGVRSPPRSPGKLGSPKRKERYGRRNYRADSARKKSL